MNVFQPIASLRETFFLLSLLACFSSQAEAAFCPEDLRMANDCPLIPEQADVVSLTRISVPLAGPEVSVFEGRYVGRDFKSGFTPNGARFLPPGSGGGAATPTFDINPAQKFQEMRGFGGNITESCSMMLMDLPPAQRREVMEKMFSKEKGAGFSVLRLPVGSSDFADGTRGSYSYNDSPNDKPDPAFKNFDMSRDEKSFALIREAKQINPELEIMATPWSAPAWMKTTKTLHGGKLAAEHYQDYANYLVKVVEEYKKRGLPLESLTIQNEPLYSTPGYPSMDMQPEEQADFVGNYLGPALEQKRLPVKIFGLDHNWEYNQDVNHMLGDRQANKYLHGIAYHCYSGNRWNMYDTFFKFPDKEVIQTECTGSDSPYNRTPESLPGDFQWWLENHSVGAVGMGTSGALGWNLCLNEKNGPQNGDKSKPWNGGCTTCRGMVKMDFSGASPEIVYNPEFHALAQVSKFVDKKARRIAMRGEFRGLVAVAFENPDGSLVFVAQNMSDKASKFNVRLPDCRIIQYEIPAKAAVTMKWKTPS